MQKVEKEKRVILLSVCSLLFLLFTFKTSAQNSVVSTPDGKTISNTRLTSEIEQIITKEKIPGISIAIINNNEVVYHEVFGVSNLLTKEPINKQSIFEGASLSKPIFAYFALKMAEEGTLDLDKPLHEYLPHPGIAPESSEDYKLITARMVLSHQTGFPNHANDQKIELAFKPGTDFMYSGEAYQYLAAVIGMQKGVGFREELNELFQKKVTKPLTMEHTTFVWDDYLEAHKVYGHDENGKPTQNKPGPGRWSGKTFNAFSSVHSEASEYAKFIIAMLKREGMQPERFNEMLKEQTHFKDDNPLKQEIGQTGWGLGFAQKQTPNLTMHMHTGNNHDFQAYAMFIPEKEYGLVVFINCGKMIPFLENLSKVLGPQF
ncbi:MAG: serine hydrolase [Bacteroidales bacterium]|nr:serine hydrolase [Bacteroidales bacterium]